MCLCVIVFTSVCMPQHTRIYIARSENNLECWCGLLDHMASELTCELLREMLALTSLYSQECWDESCMCSCAHFYVGSGHLISDSYICVTVLLPNKPSPQPQCYICLIKTFCRFSSIYFYVCLILL